MKTQEPSIEQKLYELLESVGHTDTGDAHIIDTSDPYPVEGEGSFRVYHRDGYCFEVKKVVETDDEETGDPLTYYYDYYAEWEGFDSSLTPEGAIKLVKKEFATPTKPPLSR